MKDGTNLQVKEKETTVNKEKKNGGQKRLFKKKRGGITLTKNEVKEIKQGRKKLRKQLKAAGIKSKKEFELTASSMGLYFDKRDWGLFWLFWKGKALWALLGASALLLLTLFLLSLILQMRGHFTINLNENMMSSGFRLSETEDFKNPSSILFAEPRTNAPATSISKIPDDVMSGEGKYDSSQFFAYSFFLQYEGSEQGEYKYEVRINSESLDASRACWVMVFDEGKMSYYARLGTDNQPESVPAMNDNSRGFREPFFQEYAEYPDEQYGVVATRGNSTYYRVIPLPFESESVVMQKNGKIISDQEIHKYTVVLWLEGEDPECTNDIIGGHMGIEMNFSLNYEDYHENSTNYTSFYDMISGEIGRFVNRLNSFFR